MVRFEYWHTYVVAVRQKKGEDLGRISGSNKRYPEEAIEDYLNEAGAKGWELITMTPDWRWKSWTIEFGDINYPSESAYSMPMYISGWYLVFKRLANE